MTHRVLALAALVVMIAALTAASVLTPRSAAQETAYIACVGIGDPADIGVCLPAPYPERLPLPEPDDIPV